ncbi:hypothetical protein ACFYM0_32870 [Streptomyces sp. NPDC006487]|uniref:phage baseplate protein n=1 Tax=Streptomyces sp. NPDC006487 TaxID=3364748 RepID=UPI0036C4FB02
MASRDLFQLSGTWDTALANARQHCDNMMQSIGADPVTGDIFIAQVAEGGSATGNICLNRIDPWTGQNTGSMHLNGFGHGYQIGVQHIDGKSYVWTEAGPVATKLSPSGKPVAFGTRVTRVLFNPGKYDLTMESTGTSKPFSTPFRPTLAEYPGHLAYGCAPTVDPVGHRLTIRFELKKQLSDGTFDDAGWFYAQYPIDPATGNVSGNLTRWTKSPPSSDPGAAHIYGTNFQGFASCGDYLYLYTGSKTTPANPDPDDTYITALAWPATSGQRATIAHAQKITALSELPAREPEGLAVTTVGTEAKLLFGIGGYEEPRLAAVCYVSTAPSVEGIRAYTDWLDLAAPAVTRATLQGRLIEVRGSTTLQLRGSFTCDLSTHTRVATLPAPLIPSGPIRAIVARNTGSSHVACRAEVTSAGELWIHGAGPEDRITWIDLGGFSAAWN